MKIKKAAPARYKRNERKQFPLSTGSNRGQLFRRSETLTPVKFNVSRMGALDAASLPSRVTASTGNPTPLGNPMKYTGVKMLGIACMHKSVEVPVFSQDEVEAISHMRR